MQEATFDLFTRLGYRHGAAGQRFDGQAGGARLAVRVVEASARGDVLEVTYRDATDFLKVRLALDLKRGVAVPRELVDFISRERLSAYSTEPARLELEREALARRLAQVLSRAASLGLKLRLVPGQAARS